MSFLFISGFTTTAFALDKEECLAKQKSGVFKDSDEKKVCDALISGSGGDACESAKRSVESARSLYNKSCGDAGMSGSTCKSKMKTCTDMGESEDFSTNSDLLAAFSSALGVPQDKVGGSCPKYSGQVYFERKDKYESELKDINKDLKDNKKEIADLNKDFTADVKKIQEDIADAQKDYQKLQTKTGEDQRNRATENAKTAADLAKNIRALETLIMNKRQDIDTIYMDKNNSLVQITEAAANRTCMAQVRDERKKYDAIVAGSVRSQFQSASIKKKQLNDLFQECMVKFDQGRMKLIQQSNNKIEAAEKEIRNAISDRDGITTQLSQMNETETQAKQAEEKTLTQAQTALQQKIQRATTELQSLQTTTQAKNKAALDEQDYLTKRSKSVSNSILSLGAVPSDESSTTKISQVSGAYEEYQAADMAARTSCKDDSYREQFFDSSYSKGGSSAKKGSGTK
jgi:DNA repair exonuclease SbcCD ATPase subunit